MKACTQCKKIKPYTEYYKHAFKRCGAQAYHTMCRECLLSKYKAKADLKAPKPKECKVCKKVFQPKTFNQKFCYDPCNTKPTELEKWLNKKPQKLRKRSALI
jgi:hypothetical protein